MYREEQKRERHGSRIGTLLDARNKNRVAVALLLLLLFRVVDRKSLREFKEGMGERARESFNRVIP